MQSPQPPVPERCYLSNFLCMCRSGDSLARGGTRVGSVFCGFGRLCILSGLPEWVLSS